MRAERKGPDVLVVGGGAIGCAVARILRAAGLEVAVVEPNQPEAGATWAAAGMLAPVGEAPGPGPLLRAGLESLALYPEFTETLREESGIDPGFAACGTLHVSWSEGHTGALRSRLGWQSEADPAVEWLDAAAARRQVRQLADDVAGATLVPGDARVDSRKLLEALRGSAARLGVRWIRGRAVRGLASEGGRVAGVDLDDGTRIPADAVVLAAGAWSGSVRGLPGPLPVRPVRGQMLSLGWRERTLGRMLVSPDAYLVPKEGRILVGATVEEAGFDRSTTAGGIEGLLRAALRLLPALADAPVLEIWSGLRPGSPDDLPIVGPDPSLDGLFHATGHYRNGILLAPWTARLLAGSVLSGAHAPEPFTPGRFRDGAGTPEGAIPG